MPSNLFSVSMDGLLEAVGASNPKNMEPFADEVCFHAHVARCGSGGSHMLKSSDATPPGLRSRMVSVVQQSSPQSRVVCCFWNSRRAAISAGRAGPSRSCASAHPGTFPPDDFHELTLPFLILLVYCSRNSWG